MLTLSGPDIPENLRRLPQPPRRLWVRGGAWESLLSRPRIAVVGSRRVTPYGRAATLKLAGDLARAGIVIVSGLALGVDSIAHQAALDAGGGTVAVLPAGLDRIYPRSHERLAAAITDRQGALVTEYPEGTDPLKHHFIARNRLIAGLSDGVLITEAAAGSGSLHTADFALEQGLPVMAVPGGIFSPASAGCNGLIKTGAFPVTDAQDVFDCLGWQAAPAPRARTAATGSEALLLDLLRQGVSDGGELLRRSGLGAAEFGRALTMLELRGAVRALGADHWAAG